MAMADAEERVEASLRLGLSRLFGEASREGPGLWLLVEGFGNLGLVGFWALGGFGSAFQVLLWAVGVERFGFFLGLEA